MLTTLSPSDLIFIGCGLFATGVLAGVLAGLLGVGGGIVIVPVLYNLMGVLGVDESVRMHVAVATSFATIIPTAISSARAHARRGAIDEILLRRWGPLIATGTIIGTIAGNFMNGHALSAVFAFVALFVAFDLVRRRNAAAGDIATAHLPGRFAQYAIATAIGIFSSLMGIGGGTLTVPILNWFSYPILRAVATSSFFGLIIAVPATIGYVLGGLGESHLPVGNFGYVSLPGFVIITAATFLTAPHGTRIAHAVSPKTLRLIFAMFLAATSASMFSKL